MGVRSVGAPTRGGPSCGDPVRGGPARGGSSCRGPSCGGPKKRRGARRGILDVTLDLRVPWLFSTPEGTWTSLSSLGGVRSAGGGMGDVRGDEG